MDVNEHERLSISTLDSNEVMEQHFIAAFYLTVTVEW